MMRLDARVRGEGRAGAGAWAAGLMLLLGLLLGPGAVPAAGQGGGGSGGSAGCALCHGELELLRQHVPSLERAREVLVRPEALRASAHGEMSCVECHRGYGSFPHRERGPVTASCASCHQKADTAWAAGEHAKRQADGTLGAACAACHGVHDVATAKALETSAAQKAARGEARLSPAQAQLAARCATCHQEDSLPKHDPHAGTVGCWECHSSHTVHEAKSARASIAPARQAATCGGCHDTVAADWKGDVHAAAVQRAVRRGGRDAVLPVTDSVPACSGCHGGHGMVPTADSAAFAIAAVQRCGDCHQKWRDTFFGSYHGKAARLGSAAAATCDNCHGAHGIFPADDPRSMVHTANLVETCKPCHAYARPAFTQYDAHPDVFDWERNWVLTASFWFMNSLLIGVLGVFGLHTVLWWVRLMLDKRKGIGHGHGHGGPGDGGPGTN